ncbi:MAG TPA: hypothetical protein VFO39_10660 [Candidatus Sulfotelmatobacter sp.]|nr:hypothetical protein [Candidatus Sulfotelmatobacter sp.]
MSGNRVVSIVLTVVSLLVVSAVAQDEKNELTGTIGRTFISDQGIQGATFFDPIIHSGKGTSFEIGYARRLWVNPLFAISAEVPAMFNLDEDLNAGTFQHAVVPTDYKAFFVAPSARLNLFPSTAFSPWISFGGGVAHFSQGRQLDFGGTNPGKSTTSGVAQGGFGLDVRLLRGLGVRGEVRDFWSGEPDFPLAPTGKTRQHNFYVAGGFVLRF